MRQAKHLERRNRRLLSVRSQGVFSNMIEVQRNSALADLQHSAGHQNLVRKLVRRVLHIESVVAVTADAASKNIYILMSKHMDTAHPDRHRIEGA